jgi:hypothetical protein
MSLPPLPALVDFLKTVGISTGVMIGVSWVLWGQVDEQWNTREQEMTLLRKEIQEDKEYVRTKFTEVIERNTQAFIELKQELIKRQ